MPLAIAPDPSQHPTPSPGASGDLLEIRGLHISFRSPGGGVHNAVFNLNLTLRKGETLGLVGESGCGKTVTALSTLRLLQEPPAEVRAKGIYFEGRDLLSFGRREIRTIRGKEIAMIFQEPMTALNPVLTIGYQIAEGILAHQSISKREARKMGIELLKKVGIPAPDDRFDEYPHQLSGGMRQRAMIAMALALNPKLLIADEPTTALDVTIQAQILQLLNRLQKETGMAMLLITHNMGIVEETCDRLAVMYLGQIVEQGNVQEIFSNPLHPYTMGLLASEPQIFKDGHKKKLNPIPGSVPLRWEGGNRCRFADRCSRVMDICRQSEPHDVRQADGRVVKCYLYE
ncbi:MAG: ABC transporter ATP-binding protein [Nitrospirae bacterium]|nr:ABC transporter ATP-binding protein [Nitrospirota bacterium]